MRTVAADDRRVAKTRRSLHDALARLVREKTYDTISVKEILDRANVGRSTFYTHFDDKDELLASVLGEMLSAAPPARTTGDRAVPQERLIAFSRPLFEHIHAHGGSGGTPLGTRGRAVLHEQLQKALAQLIFERASTELAKSRRHKSHVTAELLSQYIASTFVLVLNGCMASRNSWTPKEADAAFRELVLPTLTALG